MPASTVMMESSKHAWVAGADGCPGGWLVVFRSVAAQGHRAQIFQELADAFKELEKPELIAVDIPIGLPKISRKGGRSADIKARKVLKLRKSSIFPAPSRTVLKAGSIGEAREIERRNSKPPKSLTKQVFNLLDKIRQLDAIAARRLGTIFECHPEVSFWAMNNKTEMSLPKAKIAGNRSAAQRPGSKRVQTFISNHASRFLQRTQLG